MNEKGTKEFLTVAELAEILKVSPKQIYKMVRKGCPHYRLMPEGQMRFRLDDVEEWMYANSSLKKNEDRNAEELPDL